MYYCTEVASKKYVCLSTIINLKIINCSDIYPDELELKKKNEDP